MAVGDSSSIAREPAVQRVAAVERLLRHLDGSPVAARAPGLILGDRPGEWVGEARRPSNERDGEQRTELDEGFAAGG